MMKANLIQSASVIIMYKTGKGGRGGDTNGA